MKPMRVFAPALIALSIPASGGCLALAVGAATGVGAYAYINGELKDTEEVPLDRAYAAAKTAIAQLEFATVRDSKDALQARLTARQADDTDIHIALDSKGDKLTEIRIRVGVFGDESRSRLVMDKIKQNF